MVYASGRHLYLRVGQGDDVLAALPHNVVFSELRKVDAGMDGHVNRYGHFPFAWLQTYVDRHGEDCAAQARLVGVRDKFMYLQFRSMQAREVRGLLHYEAQRVEAFTALLRKEDPFMIPPTLVKDLAKEKNEIANNLLHSLAEIKWKPAKIEVADERTYAFMEPITEGLGIDLVKLPETEELDEVLDDFLSSVDPASSGIYPDADDPDGFYAGADDPEAQIMELIGLLLSMPDKDVRMIPAELKEHVRMLLGLGILPPEVEAQLRKKLF